MTEQSEAIGEMECEVFGPESSLFQPRRDVSDRPFRVLLQCASKEAAYGAIGSISKGRAFFCENTCGFIAHIQGQIVVRCVDSHRISTLGKFHDASRIRNSLREPASPELPPGALGPVKGQQRIDAQM